LGWIPEQLREPQVLIKAMGEIKLGRLCTEVECRYRQTFSPPGMVRLVTETLGHACHDGRVIAGR
jgi:hypothetical protein